MQAGFVRVQTVPPASLLPGDQCPGKDFGFCECVFYF